jgi:hypothetical protein
MSVLLQRRSSFLFNIDFRFARQEAPRQARSGTLARRRVLDAGSRRVIA